MSTATLASCGLQPRVDATWSLPTAARIAVGRTNLPLVNEGEALVHIARFADTTTAEATLEAFREELLPEDDQEAVAEEFYV